MLYDLSEQPIVHIPSEAFWSYILHLWIQTLLLWQKPMCFWPKDLSAWSISWSHRAHQHPFSPPSCRPPITSNHISSDLWSVTCVGIRCHACLSITQILIDKIPRPYIPCPFKGYRQRMLRIDTDLICHWPRRGTANKAHGNTAEKNSSWLTGLVWSFATKPVVLQIWFLFHISNQIKSCGRTGFTAIARNSLSEYDHISR